MKTAVLIYMWGPLRPRVFSYRLSRHFKHVKQGRMYHFVKWYIRAFNTIWSHWLKWDVEPWKYLLQHHEHGGVHIASLCFTHIMAISRQNEAQIRTSLVPVFLNDFKDSFWIVHVTVGSNARAILLNGLEHCIGLTQPHHHDEKHPARPGFEPGTSKLRATELNEPSESAYSAAPIENSSDNWLLIALKVKECPKTCCLSDRRGIGCFRVSHRPLVLLGFFETTNLSKSTHIGLYWHNRHKPPLSCITVFLSGVSCNAKSNKSNCLLDKWAVTAVCRRLCQGKQP